MFYWACILGFACLFGSWRGRQSVDLDSTVRAICITALLTVPVGILAGEIEGWLASSSTFDSGYGGLACAKTAIWVGLMVGAVSVLWGKWQTLSHIAADRTRPL